MLHNVKTFLRNSINTISSTTKVQKLVQICAIRWVDRHESVSTFSNLQFTVVEALAEISAGQTERNFITSFAVAFDNYAK